MSEELTFDEAQEELERIVSKLESGTVGLDEALALWGRGEELYRICTGKLDAAHGQIEQLLLDGQAPEAEPPAAEEEGSS